MNLRNRIKNWSITFVGNLKKLTFFFRILGRRRIAILFCSSLIIAVFELMGMGVIAPFIAILSDPRMVETNRYLAWAYHAGNFSSTRDFLVALGMGIIALICFKNLFVIFVKHIQFKFSYEAQHIFSTRLLETYLGKNYLSFTGVGSSLLLRNVSNITGSLVQGLMIPALAIFTDFFLMTSLLTLLFFINPWITFGLAFFLGSTFALLQGVFRKKLAELGRSKNIESARVFKILSDSFQGIKDVKILNREPYFYKRFEESSRVGVTVDTHFQTITILPPLLLEAIGLSSIVVIVMYLIYSGSPLGGIISLVSFYVLAAYRLLPSVSRMAPNLHSIRFYAFSMDVVYRELKELVRSQPFDRMSSQTQKKLSLSRSIQFENVSFRYPSSSQFALENITVEIKKHQSIGLVGSSGGGKTTFVDLLLGLMLPTEGNISIDREELSENKIANWRKSVGYIPQQIFLMDDTIEANIAFGVDPKLVDQQSIARAVKIAQLEKVIASLPLGLKTEIGERGVRLSGGQRQRIGIARALYHDPEVVIMDEATAALDNLTEADIVEEITQLQRLKTLVVIAHRLTTVRNCDLIYVFDHGKIVASGKYQELLLTNDLFKRMVNITSAHG